MDMDDWPDPQEALILSMATRLQVIERVLQSLLIMQLRDAPDSQRIIERLRMYCLGNPQLSEEFTAIMETYLAHMEGIAHQNPPRP